MKTQRAEAEYRTHADRLRAQEADRAYRWRDAFRRYDVGQLVRLLEADTIRRIRQREG